MKSEEGWGRGELLAKRPASRTNRPPIRGHIPPIINRLLRRPTKPHPPLRRTTPLRLSLIFPLNRLLKHPSIRLPRRTSRSAIRPTILINRLTARRDISPPTHSTPIRLTRPIRITDTAKRPMNIHKFHTPHNKKHHISNISKQYTPYVLINLKPPIDANPHLQNSKKKPT